jgi:Tfp pilus assembly protein FimT
MRRLLLVFVVVAVMVATMAVPAFAVTGNEQSSNSDNLVLAKKVS